MTVSLTEEVVRARIRARGDVEWIDGDYTSVQSILTLRCPLGHVWSRTAGVAIRGGCKVCSKRLIGAAQRVRARPGMKTWGELVTAARVHEVLVVCEHPDERVLSATKVTATCRCGRSFTATAKSLWSGNQRSCGCLLDEARKENGRRNAERSTEAKAALGRRRWSVKRELVEEQARRLEVTLAVPVAEMLHTRQELSLVCACGSLFRARVVDFLRGMVRSCGCLRSSAERVIAGWLQAWNVPYKQNAGRVISGKHRYFLDFYLADRRLGIEHNGLWCHGQAHYEKIGRVDGVTHCKDKHDLMLVRGDRLVTIFEDEMLGRPDAVKGYLAGVLGLKETAGAR